MIRGVITPDREALIRIGVRGLGGQKAQMDAVIDTGFNGFLTLPVQLIADLALPFAGATRAVLGDGREVSVDVFEVTVLWGDQERSIVALATEGSALVGMALLFGNRVTLDVEDAGSVIIEALA